MRGSHAPYSVALGSSSPRRQNRELQRRGPIYSTGISEFRFNRLRVRLPLLGWCGIYPLALLLSPGCAGQNSTCHGDPSSPWWREKGCGRYAVVLAERIERERETTCRVVVRLGRGPGRAHQCWLRTPRRGQWCCAVTSVGVRTVEASLARGECSHGSDRPWRW